MDRILLRARKDPFEIVDPETALVRNTFGDNSGNLIFSFAAHRILETAGTSVTADHFVMDPGDADRINAEYSAYVIPLANAFRPTFEAHLIRLTALIRRLRIPVVILGVGAQSNLRYETARLAPMEPAVKAFVSAVLDRSPSIGVRGELTYDYLQGLGFRDVEVIGCPSMFVHGDRLQIEKRRPRLEPDTPISINVSPYVKAMGPVVAHHVERYPNLTYIAQDIDTLEMLVWGEDIKPADRSEPRPIHLAHPLFRADKVRLFLDPPRWFEFLATVEFAFGTRIHGNIAALIAGTPSYVFAHDSRTLELARYFEIPHRRIDEVRPDLDAADLYAEADYGPLNRGHPGRFAAFVDYLERHGLDHAFKSPSPRPDFDARVRATAYPPGVSRASHTVTPGLRGRLGRWRRRSRRLLRVPWVRRARVRLARLTARAGGRGDASGASGVPAEGD